MSNKEAGQQNLQGMFNKKTKKEKEESKTKLKTALILLEDVDIVFEELGMTNNVKQLVQIP